MTIKEIPMKYGRVPGIEKNISKLVQGAIMLSVETETENIRLFDAAFDAGGTTFDTDHEMAWLELRSDTRA